MGENESNSSNHIEKTCKHISIKIPEDLQTTFRREECIYKAPAALCDSNRASYTPRVISIGPFHHDSEKLRPMEIQKQRYLKEFCKRLRGKTKEQVQESLNVLSSTIEDEKDEIKHCYADDTFVEFSKDDEKFVKMILFDAVFIFELFLKNEEDIRDNKRYQDDFIIGKPWLRAAIQRDLILLENQLPFFILEKLYSLAIEETKPGYLSFLDLSCRYFEKYGKNKTKPCKVWHFTDLVRHFLSFKHPKLESPDGKQIKKLYSPTMLHQAGIKFKALSDHFTDLVRHFLSFKHPQLESPDGKQIKNLYSATMLHQAGIKFKALPNACLLDIRAWKENENPVKKGELHMPPLEIDNSTECLFRNLMALEQCHYPREELICRYVKLLDFLVDDKKDVDLLIENKVLVSRLGDSKAVAELINKLCLEIVEVTSGYDALSQLLNDYYESSWNKNKAYLVSVYFHNVWIGTGTVIGLIILAITVARFILSFFR
ncbi:hypothetical protein H0E87_024119 [Populus deltoides]|uniref:Uncharacterized protein n=1 Tax=Populus deltoides TaxID=3696 RepID=A0A8T2X890_POPDE|nr:hypothetical protein H0E87_024119 [Populus deltoides]